MHYRPGFFRIIYIAVLWAGVKPALGQDLFNELKTDLKELRGSDPSFHIIPTTEETFYSEYPVAISQSGLLFISNRPVNKPVKRINRTPSMGFDRLYFSAIGEDGALLAPGLVVPELLQRRIVHVGSSYVFSNQKEAIATLTARVPKSEKALPKLFKTRIEDQRWMIGEELFSGQEGSFSQPFVDETNGVIYFVSDFAGGYGGTDIYIYRGDKPEAFENAGPLINTPGNEMFPFVNSDGYLYFSSDGHDGYGGIDLFRAGCKERNFGKPRNLGPDINSEANEFAMIFDQFGSRGYFSTDRRKKGSADIYHFYMIQGSPNAELE